MLARAWPPLRKAGAAPQVEAKRAAEGARPGRFPRPRPDHSCSNPLVKITGWMVFSMKNVYEAEVAVSLMSKAKP